MAGEFYGGFAFFISFFGLRGHIDTVFGAANNIGSEVSETFRLVFDVNRERHKSGFDLFVLNVRDGIFVAESIFYIAVAEREGGHKTQAQVFGEAQAGNYADIKTKIGLGGGIGQRVERGEVFNGFYGKIHIVHTQQKAKMIFPAVEFGEVFRLSCSAFLGHSCPVEQRNENQQTKDIY